MRVLTLAAAVAGAYTWLSPRATRWGDHLIIGPRFNGEVSLENDELTGTRAGRVLRHAN